MWGKEYCIWSQQHQVQTVMSTFGVTLGKLLDCSCPKCPQVTLPSISEVLFCTSGFKNGKLCKWESPTWPRSLQALKERRQEN